MGHSSDLWYTAETFIRGLDHRPPLLAGSIACLIVVDQAERGGVRIGWAEHARVGVPVTLATLAVAGVWLAWRFGG